MTDTHTPSPEEIKHVQDEAEDLEDRAKHDGVLPDDEAEGDGDTRGARPPASLSAAGVEPEAPLGADAGPPAGEPAAGEAR